jgi:hypothetical protein
MVIQTSCTSKQAYKAELESFIRKEQALFLDQHSTNHAEISISCMMDSTHFNLLSTGT